MTHSVLFYTEPLVCMHELRQRAQHIIEGSALINECAEGNKKAVGALFVGFWPFVRTFGTKIDQQKLPLRPLAELFGKERVRDYFAQVAPIVESMAKEEGDHAEIWFGDSEGIGIGLTHQESPFAGIRELTEMAEDKDMVAFFGHLAGTEFIAEELSRFLCGSEPFTNLLGGAWGWGDVHLEEHDGPSHLEIDVDLGSAYAVAACDNPVSVRESAMDALTDAIVRSQNAFKTAADEIYVSVV